MCAQAAGEQYFFISLRWQRSWSAYLDTGTSPPGPVSNSDLLVAEGTERRAGLVEGVQYLVTNAMCWAMYMDMYGGGPRICGDSSDIYAASVEVSAAEGTGRGSAASPEPSK